MPSVLYLCEFGTVYGGENSLLAVLPHLQQQGYDVSVAGPINTKLEARAQELGVAYVPFAWRDREGIRKPLELLRQELDQLVRQQSVDFVHANSLSVARILGPVERPGSTKFVGHIRDIIKLSRKAVGDVDLLDHVFCVSTATRNYHLQAGLRESNTSVLHNGIDLALFCPTTTSPQNQPIRLVSIGQWVMRKGLDTLLAAAHQIHQRGYSFRLDLYGERHSEKQEAVEYVANLKRFVAQNALSDTVSFRGRTDDVPRVFAESDILLHAARQEPWGRVLLEGAACGMPIVATDVGGTREMFPTGQAMLVPPDDFQAMGEAVCDLIDDSAARSRLSVSARHRAECFDITEYADRLVESYQKIASGC